MGADFIDYIIADQVTIPNKFQNFYNEAIIRLPDCYMPTDNTRSISNKSFETRRTWLTQRIVLFFAALTIIIKSHRLNLIFGCGYFQNLEVAFFGSEIHSQLARENL